MQPRFLRPIAFVLAGLVLLGIGYGLVTPQPSSACFLNEVAYCYKGSVSSAALWAGIGILITGAITIVASFVWLYMLSYRDSERVGNR